MKRIICFIVFSLCFFVASGTAMADYEKIKIAVLPFHLQGENFETEDMGKIVAEWLITAFVKEGRFDVVERSLLGKILEEQQMVEAGLVSQETASEIGRLLGVKVIISGSVMKLRDVLEVNARIIDVSTASIVTAENVQSRNVHALHPLVIEMADKIIKNFPLEGYIANRDGKDVVIDLGEIAGVKPGMKFIAYKEGEVVRHPKTDEILYVKQNETGTIKVISVQQKISVGIILDEINEGAIEYGDQVKSVSGMPLATTQPVPLPQVTEEPVATSPPPPERESGEVKIIMASSSKKFSYKAKDSGLSDEVQSYLIMLKGSDSKQVRYAAKKLYKTYPYEPVLLEEVNRVLLQGYNSNNEDKNHVDAMAWLCKLLANSKDIRYKPTVQEVINNTQSPKIKKHAEKAITLF